MTRVAAIDCGTHSIRLLVAEPTADGTALIDHARRMEIVRLGRGVDSTGRLAPDAIDRTRFALTGFVRQIEALGVERVRMVATSATRDAENADEFQAMVRATLGVTPEVVSGEDEALLSFAGAVTDLPTDLPGPVLVVDVGGGSTEFVVGERWHGAAVAGAVSVDVGCVRMTERYLLGDPPTREQVDAASAEITALVDQALAKVGASAARTLVGLAGSVTTIVGVALDLDRYQPERIHHSRISYASVARTSDELLRATRAQRLAIPVMHPGRVDVIGAGALIVRTVLERAGFDEMVASEHDILDGIAWSLI